jgi:hypothetical protein
MQKQSFRRLSVLGFIRLILASHIVPRIRYLEFTLKGRRVPWLRWRICLLANPNKIWYTYKPSTLLSLPLVRIHRWCPRLSRIDPATAVLPLFFAGGGGRAQGASVRRWRLTYSSTPTSPIHGSRGIRDHHCICTTCWICISSSIRIHFS